MHCLDALVFCDSARESMVLWRLLSQLRREREQTALDSRLQPLARSFHLRKLWHSVILAEL
jgi:hypothetical protein